MMLTRKEKETIILFNEAETTAEVFTFNKALQNRIESLSVEYPDLFKKTLDSEDGAKFYTVPKKYVAIKKPPQISPETRGKLIENLKSKTISKEG